MMHPIQPNQINVNPFLMARSNTVVSSRIEGARGSQILKYKDGTEWVVLPINKVQERFCGFLYLNRAIKNSGLEHIKAAENKIAIHNEKQIIYLSRYCGDTKPEDSDHKEEISILERKIGFIDTIYNANLRKQDDAIFVFDTEKNSFAQQLHGIIDSFIPLHNALLALLIESSGYDQEQIDHLKQEAQEILRASQPIRFDSASRVVKCSALEGKEEE